MRGEDPNYGEGEERPPWDGGVREQVGAGEKKRRFYATGPPELGTKEVRSGIVVDGHKAGSPHLLAGGLVRMVSPARSWRRLREKRGVTGALKVFSQLHSYGCRASGFSPLL